MALSGQVINLIGLDFLDDADQVGCIGKIAIMHEKPHILLVGVYMIHPRGVKRRRPAFDTVDFIVFIQQKLGQISTVLACNSGYKRTFHQFLLIAVAMLSKFITKS